jgi:hypothetical protein
MTMTDETHETEITPKKKPAKKPRKKARTRVLATVPQAPRSVLNPFGGISPSECCDGCNENKCVISGINVCAHPMKGGLQSAQMRDPEALKRFNRAKAALKDQMIDLRGR